MGKLNKWLLLGFVIVSLLLSLEVCHSIKVKKELAALSSKYDEQVTITALQKKESDERISKLVEENQMLDGMIDSYNTVIAKKEDEILHGNAKVLNLEEKLKNAQSDAERVVILTEEVEVLKVQFSLCREELAEKDKVIFSLTQKYQNQLRISTELQNQLQEQMALNDSCSSLRKTLEGRLVHLQRTSQLKTYLGLGLIGLVVLSLAR